MLILIQLDFINKLRTDVRFTKITVFQMNEILIE